MLAGLDPHTTPVGAWCDAAWAAHVDFVISATAAGGPPVVEGIDETWQRMVGATPTTAPATSSDAAAPSSPPLRPGAPPRFDPPIDPETGQPRRPTKAEREAWAVQFAGGNDLLGGAAGASSGAAPRVGG